MILAYFAWSLLIAIVTGVVVLYSRQRRFLKRMKNVPGTPPMFILGNVSWVLSIYSRAIQMKHHPGVYISERIVGNSILYQKSGMNYVWFAFSGQPMVVLYKPEIIELILGNSVSLEKSLEYNFLHPWMGTGLLTSKGGKWKHRRKLLTPSFHFRILEDFLPVFHQQSLVLVDKLKSLTNTEEYVNIEPLIILCTLDVICETVMGVSIEAQKGSNSEYVHAIHNVADYFNKRIPQPWLWPDFLFRLTSMGKKFYHDVHTLHSFTDKVIKEKKQNLLGGTDDTGTVNDTLENEYYAKRRKTFMDLLLDMHINGEQLSEADIREEVDTFMFEGHDTTAMGIIYALYCIGLYPKIQRKIAEELDEIYGGDTERPVTFDDVRDMKYLECVLKESQRLFPSVPIIGRQLSEDLIYGDAVIPKHTMIHCNILNLHRNSEVFPNPEVFDPNRFLPENSAKRHPYAYIPFSAGPRNCIGQKFAMLEEKTIVSNILRHFKVASLDPRDKFLTKVEFTLRPAQEVRMKFSPRY